MNAEALPYGELIIIGVIVLAFILMLKKGGKFSLFGQTVEVPIGDKKQKIDTIVNVMEGNQTHQRGVRARLVCRWIRTKRRF